MALIVQKYGGSSVATPELMKKVAKRAIAAKNEGNKVVVVLSAMKGETDKLLKLARSVTPEPNPRELDTLVSTGEQVSVALFAMTAQSLGETVKSFLGFQAGISTDDNHGKARILSADPARIATELAKGRLAVVAGFQGIDKHGDITTLGRGGSDTTAVALAVALGADVCEIHTDVDGIFTTDPNVCRDARKMEKISYEEMLELSSLGAKVMEIRSVELGMVHNLKIHVRNAHNPSPGTIICQEDESMEKTPVRGVTHSTDEARITLVNVRDRPGVAARILSVVSKAEIVVDMIIQNKSAEGDGNRTDFSFTVPSNDYDKAMELLGNVLNELEAEKILGDDNIAKISLVGAGMRNHAGVAAKMFRTLAAEGININMISTSEIKISCVIEKKYAELAVRVLHEAFRLDLPPGENGGTEDI
ncbi:MAG: aspartate kinase [Deltaproteobacteria bacterium]|jgi:aspartate kinase|nr:aspartate kinase [Deltaproteobacteria bacterium]